MAERISGILEAEDFERVARAVLALVLLRASGPTARRGAMSGAISLLAARGIASATRVAMFARARIRDLERRIT